MEDRTMKREESIVIIGGGPAGIAAAIEAARAGVKCVLIEEAPSIGGQVYRKTSENFQDISKDTLREEQVRWKKLSAEFNQVADRIRVLSSTSVLGIWKNHEILWGAKATSGIIQANQIIIATGAYERPVPFPGWTLPGVMTAGGIKSFIKTMHVKPGKRAIISGTGPLIISTANRLSEIGVEVVAVLEAGNPPWSSSSFLKEWGKVDFAKDIAEDLEELQRKRIPLLFNHSVFAAHGKDEVSTVSYGPVQLKDWKPLKDQGKIVEADLIGLGFGFIPNTELTRLVGCKHEFCPGIGWFVVRDAFMQTSVPGIFAAGDNAGISGAIIAEEEGRIAGIKAAQNTGVITSDEAKRRYEISFSRIHSFENFRKTVNEATAFRDGLLELIEPETIVCRCEEVQLLEVQQALKEGAADLQAIKLFTRLGMGACQGRNCSPSTGMYLQHKLNLTPEEVGAINPRPPVKPVTLGAWAKMLNEKETNQSDSFDAINKGGRL
jgi:thioredoxin reductase